MFIRVCCEMYYVEVLHESRIIIENERRLYLHLMVQSCSTISVFTLTDEMKTIDRDLLVDIMMQNK